MAKEQKKEKKVKVSKTEGSDNEEETPRFQSPIAHPLAEKKLVKKLYKTIKKGNFVNLKSNCQFAKHLYFNS